MRVVIGVDPHKGSHTAVAIDEHEQQLAQMQVRSGPRQLEQLLAWAAEFGERTWAVESAGGLGYLLAQQLVGAGEQVLDVPATLASRVRVLATTKSQKTDPQRCAVDRDRRAFTRSAIGGAGGSRGRVAAVGETASGSGSGPEPDRVSAPCVVDRARPGRYFQGNHGERSPGAPRPDRRPRTRSRRSDTTSRVSISTTSVTSTPRCGHRNARLEAAVRASGTTVTDIFGVGPVVAAMVIGHTRNIDRFADRDHFAAYAGTAPIEFESGGRSIRRLSLRGNRQLNHAIHIAAVTQIRHRHSPGRAFYDRKLAEGKTKKEAIRALKRRISDALYRQLRADAARTMRAREGKRGRLINPA